MKRTTTKILSILLTLAMMFGMLPTMSFAEDGCAHANAYHINRVESSCYGPGVIEHWFCEDCWCYYDSADMQTEIMPGEDNDYCDPNEMLVIPATGHNFTEDGFCNNCGMSIPVYSKVTSLDDINEEDMYIFVAEVGDKTYALEVPFLYDCYYGCYGHIRDVEATEGNAVEVTVNDDGTISVLDKNVAEVMFDVNPENWNMTDIGLTTVMPLLPNHVIGSFQSHGYGDMSYDYYGSPYYHENHYPTGDGGSPWVIDFYTTEVTDDTYRYEDEFGSKTHAEQVADGNIEENISEGNLLLYPANFYAVGGAMFTLRFRTYDNEETVQNYFICGEDWALEGAGEWDSDTGKVPTNDIQYAVSLYRYDTNVNSEEESCNFDDWVADELSDTHTRTCRDENCGKTETEPCELSDWTSKSKNEHSKTCSVCDREISAEHKWGDGVITNVATTVSAGSIRYTCADCNFVKTDVIPKIVCEHSWGDWTEDNAKTHSRYCDKENGCTAYVSQPHQWNQGVITVEATELQEGEITYTCLTCGYEKTEAVPMLEHNHIFGDWADDGNGGHIRICENGNVCSAEEKGSHTCNEWTDNENGTHIGHCSVCGTEIIESHSWSDWKENHLESKLVRTCVCDAFEELTMAKPVENVLTNNTVPENNSANADLIVEEVVDLFNSILSEEEQTEVAEGATVSVYLQVEDIPQNSVPVSDKTATEEAVAENSDLGEDAEIGMYLDIELFKEITVDNETQESQITETSGMVTITIEIPEELINDNDEIERIYRIVRVHQDENGNITTEIIEGKFDPADNTFTFETDKFSIYAIAYVDQEANNIECMATIDDIDFGTVTVGYDEECMHPLVANTGTEWLYLTHFSIALTGGDVDAFRCGWNDGPGAIENGGATEKAYVWCEEGLETGTYTATLSLYYDYDGNSNDEYEAEVLDTATVTITVRDTEIYHLTCNAFNITDNGAAGTVSIETDLESDEGSLAEADATENKSVTITAAAYSGYEFVEWRKSAPANPQAMVSTNASYTFTATESTWYYALFKKSEVFTQQPSFSRKDDNSGTVSFNLYSVEWEIQPMIIPADGNENSNPLAYFNNQTIAQSAEILKTNVAEGSYKIAVKYGDVWYFSDAFEVSYTSTLHFTTQPEDASVALGQPYYPEWAMDFVPDEVIIESGVMNGQQQLEWSTFSTYANATGGTIQAQSEGEYTLRVKATKGGEVVYSDVFVVTYADIYSFAVTPLTADWGTVGIASSYPEKTVEIENTGTKNILLEVGTKDGFAISIDNVQLPLAVGDTTTLRIRPNNNIPAGVYDFDLTVKATDGNTEKYSVNVPVYIKVEAPVFTTVPQDGVVPVNESYNVSFELSREPDSLELQWWNDYSHAWATKTVLESDATTTTVPAEDEATSLTYRIAANYNIGYTYTVAEEFTVEWEEVPQITEMSATVSGIEAGQTVGSATVSSGGNDYTTTIIQWQKTDDVWNYSDTVNYPALDDETTFIGGESYVVGVKFTPVAPNVISSTQVSATINGENGKGGEWDNGSRIYFVLVEVPEKTYHITCNAFNISDSEDAGTVTLVTDKGTFSGELAEGDATENSEVTITAAANPGYEFVEWRKSAPASPQAMVSTNASYTFTATESTWYYAIFQKATIFTTQPEFNIVTPGDNGKITLTLNERFNYADIQLVKENGSVDDEFSAYHKGVHFLVEENTYTATEYKGEGTYQTPEGNYKVAVKIGDEWFYSNVFAVNYGVVEYTLTFDANGGTGEMDPLTGQTSYILPQCTFVAPSGMHFAGWNVFGYTQAPGTQAILTSDRTAQAVWEADLTYIINASQSGTYYFPNQQTGYASVDPLEVTITNEGTGATGELNITLYGEGADKFTLSKTTVSSIDAGEDDSFTVTPITGITPGVYVAQVMIQGEHNLLKTFDVSLTVTDAPTHIIEISLTENHTFTSANASYGAQTPLTVTINSIGTGDSGELEIGLTGANPTSFELSKTAVDSIASGENDSFTVVPKTGLEAGTYTATVYVSGEYDIYKVFGVSFTVIGELGGEVIVNGDAKYGSTLTADVSGVTGNTGTLSYQWMSGDNNVGTNSSSYTITEEDIGNTIKVIVTGDVETGNVTSAPTAVVEKADGPEAPVVTPHAPSLEGLSDGKITGTTNEMEWADNAEFTDAEVCTGSEITGLEAGTYYVRFAETSTTKAGEAAVVVVPEGAEITYSISLDKADTFTFDSMVEGYLSMTPADVTITNTGTGETGELAVALSGANADSFTLSVNTIDNISAGGNDSFTVVPVVGLSAGTYTATITVSGSNDISESFNVSFTVTIAPVAPTYTVTFDANGGTVTPTEATTDAEGKLAELPTAERSNYTFKGWYTATTGGTKITTSTVFTEDTTVYAQWRRNGGGGGGGSATSYTVKFETNGGSKINNKTVSENEKVKEPTVPTKDGFEFAGWYTDKELTVEYDFDTKVKKNFTLYAKWIEVQEEPVNDKDDWFADVNENDWFYESVKYVTENGLMNGVTEDTFAPYETLTRAMLVTVLYRLEGEPATNRSIPFADIDMGEYYASAVIWAQQNGIVNGVTDTLFAPNDNITREQIAAIMFRYAIYKGMEAVTLEENLHFSDADKISEYAVSAMNWAVGCGLMKGKTATTVNPKDIATRAEFAAILMRFTQKK